MNSLCIADYLLLHAARENVFSEQNQTIYTELFLTISLKYVKYNAQ